MDFMWTISGFVETSDRNKVINGLQQRVSLGKRKAKMLKQYLEYTLPKKLALP
jgi:hypothetical protein